MSSLTGKKEVRDSRRTFPYVLELYAGFRQSSKRYSPEYYSRTLWELVQHDIAIHRDPAHRGSAHQAQARHLSSRAAHCISSCCEAFVGRYVFFKKMVTLGEVQSVRTILHEVSVRGIGELMSCQAHGSKIVHDPIRSVPVGYALIENSHRFISCALNPESGRRVLRKYTILSCQENTKVIGFLYELYERALLIPAR